jgi:siderophore synthetase component
MMKFDYTLYFGKKRKTAVQWAVFSVVLASLVAGLHQCTGISEKNIWNLIDQIQRELTRKGVKVPEGLNDYFIQTPERLDQRVKGDVNNAIQRYEIEEKKLYKPRMTNPDILKEIEKPRYTESQRTIVKDAIYYQCPPDSSVSQSLLGGAQGIHASWYESKECKY